MHLSPVWTFGLGLASAVFFGACLFMALFRWETASANMRKAGKRLSRTQAILAGFLMVGLSLAAAWMGYSDMPDSPPSRIASLDDAKLYVVGTWVYAEPLDMKNQYVSNWVKWVIHEDGGIDAYYARPVDDSWGQPQRIRGDVITDKFTDTGERFYAVKIANTAEIAFLGRLGLAYTINGQGGVLMRRGDRNPFSK